MIESEVSDYDYPALDPMEIFALTGGFRDEERDADIGEEDEEFPLDEEEPLF